MDPDPAADRTNRPVDPPLTDLHHGNSDVDEIRKNSRSSSSSSDSSDDDDYFQIDTGEFEKPTLQPGGAVSTDGFEFQQQPTQSPQVQATPDPNRIPASVFARNKSAAPADWSVASNESLFSIHMGNSSFSRDHILLSMDSSLSPLPPLPLSPPLSPMPVIPPNLPRPPISPVSQKHYNVEPAGPTNSGAGEGVAEEEKLEKAGDPMNNSASISRQSDSSTTSFQSFAFPILSGERRSGSSIKVEPEPQQQSQPDDQSEQQQSPKKETIETETAKTTAATKTKGWLSCFSCCQGRS